MQEQVFCQELWPVGEPSRSGVILKSSLILKGWITWRRTHTGAIPENLQILGLEKFGKGCIPWKGPDSGMAEALVLWTDPNPHSPSPLCCLGREGRKLSEGICSQMGRSGFFTFALTSRYPTLVLIGKNLNEFSPGWVWFTHQLCLPFT